MIKNALFLLHENKINNKKLINLPNWAMNMLSVGTTILEMILDLGKIEKRWTKRGAEETENNYYTHVTQG